MSPNPELRSQVIALYKQLLFLGRDYPQGYTWFRNRLHRAFAAKRHLTDEDEIRKAIAHAEFVKKGESVFSGVVTGLRSAYLLCFERLDVTRQGVVVRVG
ncbi:hypothetical protein VTJ04DRAFT_7743 [Mycothermus thermophilus]|uniref:uncharacterized protein n=1 Tax=Humicola insolens TaxID=85995 RepID=UPI0037449AFB